MTAHSLPSCFDGYETIGPTELGILIGRSTKSIRLDSSRRPETLPPKFVVPGCRLLRWRTSDVRAWMDALVQIEMNKRRQESDFAKRFPASGFTGSSGSRR